MKYIEDPIEIERKSFEIIENEMQRPNLPLLRKSIMKRVIHTTTDFVYEDILWFKEDVELKMLEGLEAGAMIVSDTQMIQAGIHKKLAGQLGVELVCAIQDLDVQEEALKQGITRSMAAIDKCFQLPVPKIFVIGNAPTAIFRILENRKRYPELANQVIGVVGVPVGFVGASESKDALWESDMPAIITKGRKGGSTIAVAIVNALLRAGK